MPSQPTPLTNSGRDGRTPSKALLSPGLQANPNDEFQYVVRYLGGQFLLVNATEGPQYTALGYRVYTGDIDDNIDNMVLVTDWNKPIPAPQGEAFGSQVREVERIEAAFAAQFREGEGGQTSDVNQDIITDSNTGTGRNTVNEAGGNGAGDNNDTGGNGTEPAA